MGFSNAVRVCTVFICISGGIYAGTHTLDTTSYNFQLNNGGGGAAAVLDGSTNIEIFCNDFANSITVPHTNYSAYLSSITSGSDLSKTRFGGNTSWNTITINDDGTDAGSNDVLDSAIVNGATALGRYQMAAFLISQYNLVAGSSASNNGIQRAIWWLLDPTSTAEIPPSLTNNSFESLESAAQWYQGTGGNSGSAGRDAFLAGYRIVSDSTMYSCGAGKPLCGGFQEQIEMAPVPEPRQFVFMLAGLLLVCLAHLRKTAGREQGESLATAQAPSSAR